VVDGPDWDQVPGVAEGRPIAVLVLAATMVIAGALLRGVDIGAGPVEG
jgi:hypothetical protein